MSAEKQYVDAKKALDIIEREVLSRGQHLTYGGVAEHLGQKPGKYARHIGQVCSLIDSACYWTKLPMLSLEKIRMNNGEHNPDSFGDAFRAVKDRLIANAETHDWIPDDIRRIKRSLDSHMHGESALLQWQHIGSFGQAGLDRITSYR
jgi:hypothetical protein